MVYFANLCVNLRDCLCDVARHVSAQSLDFLDLDEISSFLNWKHSYVSILRKERSWMDIIWSMIPIEQKERSIEGVGNRFTSQAMQYDVPRNEG